MFNSSWRERLGVWRSLLMYYGVPGRFARMQRFYAQFIQRGDLCFDIGAHVGNRLRVWDALGARMVAVEPQPALLRCLQRFFGGKHHIVLVDQAIGAEPGNATLHISSRTPTVTTLSQQWIGDVKKDKSFNAVEWDQQITVPVTTLDALIAVHGVPVFCKIDVEGFELEVLRGLTQPIATLSFEYIPASMAVALGCVERLEQLGRYEYNYSPGETHRLQEVRWLNAQEMLTVLRSINHGSGDVYARLLR
ncbi:MAG: FkbM family methyltransferase [Pseudomonadota bacterium]